MAIMPGSSMKKKSVEAPEKSMGAVQKRQTGGIDLGPSKMPGISKAPIGRAPLGPGKGMAPTFRPAMPSPVMNKMPGPMVNNVPPMIPTPPVMDVPAIPNQMDMQGGMRPPMNTPGIMAPGIPQDGLWAKYNQLNNPTAPPMRQNGMFGRPMNRGIFR